MFTVDLYNYHDFKNLFSANMVHREKYIKYEGTTQLLPKTKIHIATSELRDGIPTWCHFLGTLSSLKVSVPQDLMPQFLQPVSNGGGMMP